jgi:hypothetical protein
VAHERREQLDGTGILVVVVIGHAEHALHARIAALRHRQLLNGRGWLPTLDLRARLREDRLESVWSLAGAH